jgi:hypothetical protein
LPQLRYLPTLRAERRAELHTPQQHKAAIPYTIDVWTRSSDFSQNLFAINSHRTQFGHANVHVKQRLPGSARRAARDERGAPGPHFQSSGKGRMLEERMCSDFPKQPAPSCARRAARAERHVPRGH